MDKNASRHEGRDSAMAVLEPDTPVCDVREPEERMNAEPASAARGGRGWVRVAVWVVAAGVFFTVAASINPMRSPASETILLDEPVLRYGGVGSDVARAEPYFPSAGDQEGLLGSLEGLDTTVWFYAGVLGPTASLYATGHDPIERVALEELYRLAPELHLDSGIAMMGEVPVEIDHTGFDW